MNSLTGRDIEQLTRLLLGALSEPQLRSIVYGATGDQIYEEFVRPDLPLKYTISDLLIALEKDGITSLFLGLVYSRKPFKAELRALIARLCPEVANSSELPDMNLSVQKGGVVQQNEPTSAFAPGLQRNVRPKLTKINVGVWIERLKQIESQVCRIEVNDRPLGTGFLVGPDAVLTNWHVVEPAKKLGTVACLGCRFDYLVLSDNTRRIGTVHQLHADGIVDFQPYAPAETTGTPDTPAPIAGELDYALLRVRDPIGTERGWVPLQTATEIEAVGDPLLIIQHPDGGPMKLAMDTEAIIGRFSNGLRLRYKTNTEPGSSGSPCFSMDWDLVALHQLGDPSWKMAEFNQGIPAHLVKNSVVSKGHGSLLGAMST